MKPITWDNPNKMHIETGHKTFDRQTNLIADGNLYANTMQGGYIRAYNDTWHWQEEKQNEPGYLQNWDLDGFKDIPQSIRRKVRELGQDQQLLLYCLFHYGKTRRVVHGWIVTSEEHERLWTMVTGPTQKSCGVVEECVKYLTN